jgi:hypothetical protein
MQDADPSVDWTEWLQDNVDQDDATKLGTLRGYILEAAKHWVTSGEITHTWANKKLAKLGITTRIEKEQVYDLAAPIAAQMELRVYARNRVEALEKAKERLNGMGAGMAAKVTMAGDVAFTSGPEDHDPNVVDPDAPQTVFATLAMFREIVMLGHIAGPKFCSGGASRVLAQFGLAPIPEAKEFVVTRPVVATARTVVSAYDEASAERVADWRWDDGQTGYEIYDAVSSGDAVVEPHRFQPPAV